MYKNKMPKPEKLEKRFLRRLPAYLADGLHQLPDGATEQATDVQFGPGPLRNGLGDYHAVVTLTSGRKERFYWCKIEGWNGPY